jgi:hypothetical protein
VKTLLLILPALIIAAGCATESRRAQYEEPIQSSRSAVGAAGTETASLQGEGAAPANASPAQATLGRSLPVASKGLPDPQMQAVLDQLEALGPKPIDKLTAQEARQQPSPADAVKALLKKQGKSTETYAGG